MHNTRFGLLFTVGFFLLLLNACAYTQHSLGPDKELHEKPVPSARFCIMFPPDIAQGSKVYFDQDREGPEETVALRIFRSIYSERPSSILLETANEDQAIQECSSKGAQYLLSPRIVQWQSRASGYSFNRNAIKIEIRLIEVKPNKFIRSATFEARSSWFNSGSDDPALLMLDDSFTKTIADLIG